MFHAPPSPAAIADLGRAPFVVFCHDHRWWCPSGTRFYLRTERRCDIQAGTVPCGLRYHTLRCGSLRPGPTVQGFIRATMAREALGAAAIVLCASEFMAREALRHGASAGQVKVVPLLAPLLGEPSPVPTQTPPTILCASRMTPEKGIAQLLDAFALVRTPARLVLAGSGILESRVRDWVQTHPANDRISLVGALSEAALSTSFRDAAVIAVPSVWPEPFGLVGIEALSFGRPVVSSAAGGSADWSREELGVLSENPFDATAFAAALDRALTEPTWRERAARVGAAWVRARHGALPHVSALTVQLQPLRA